MRKMKFTLQRSSLWLCLEDSSFQEIIVNISKNQKTKEKTNTKIMKNTLKRIAQASLILIFTISLFSCDKDKDAIDDDFGMVNQFIKVKIDGVENEFTVWSNQNSVGVISIMSKGENGNALSFGISTDELETIGIGTPTSNFLITYKIDGQNGEWIADGTNSTMTILESTDKYIKAEFEFIGLNKVNETTKQFTEGSFKIRK